MSTFSDRINEDIKKAMLAKEKDRLESLRAIKAALLLANTSGQPVSEDDEIKILQKLVKQRKDAAAIYQQQNRNDLADKEIKEAAVIEKYLPEKMNEEEITAIIKAAIAETGVADMKGMGKVMGLVTQRLAGKADGKTVSEIVKKLLS